MDAAAVRAWCSQYGVPAEFERALLENPGDAGLLIRRQLAQWSLCEFGRLVYPGFQGVRHIRYLAGLLERAERGELRRLAISIGPGHGKSTLLQIFLAWFLGRDPCRRILALSANEALARRNSRTVRGIVQGSEWPWPETKLVGESLEEWYTAQGGGVRAIGQTGTVTGFRAEMILCDDLQPDAGTDLTRDTLEEWFRGVLSTRLEPSGLVVLIQTRWHDDDLIGRLAEGESSAQWEFVNIPVIAGEGDVLGRDAGEALWPERWPVSLLEQKRAEIGSGAFAAQYMGDPVPAGGAMFLPEWFEHRYERLPSVRYVTERGASGDALTRMLLGDAGVARPLPPIRIQAIDCAAKTGVRNDRSAIATVVSDLRDIYIEHIWADKVPFTDLISRVRDLNAEFRPSRIYVEAASNGFALLDVLRNDIAVPLVEYKPGTDKKEARAEAIAPLFERGKIKFPRYASWLQDALGEFLRFPHGRHDDIVDAVVIAITQMKNEMLRAASDERWEQQVTTLDGWMQR